MNKDIPTTDRHSPQSVAQVAQKLGLDGTVRHLFLCAGKTDTDKGCCSAEVGEAAWGRTKERVSEINKELAASRAPGDGPHAVVQRTAVKCLRVCAAGPIGVVYPEGVWYRNLSGENLERVLSQHLRDGKIVEDLVIANATGCSS